VGHWLKANGTPGKPQSFAVGALYNLDRGARHEALRLLGQVTALVAHCHLGVGKLYRRSGKREQAQEHLATATTMYREMGMTYWLEQAESELGS
jgi:hypothetical protein